MKAAIYTEFGGLIEVRDVADPAPEPDGVVVGVRATGLCLSDWHGWSGHDPDIVLPHVPGHELAGVIEEVGSEVTRWKSGDRITVPFVSGCGHCRECQSGNEQVCDAQFQPGFTHWGSFAERVSLHHADVNLVRLPDSMEFSTAAALGCRFVTAYRAVVAQGRVAAGEWVVVHGCGGVGLSAIQIANAFGARVIAVDIRADQLSLAADLGASQILCVRNETDVVGQIREWTEGGAQLSIDALGSEETCLHSILCLRKRGRHIQVGLMVGDEASPAIPMDRILAHELELLGSHGIQSHAYPEIFGLIANGRLAPNRLIGRTVSLQDVPELLPTMNDSKNTGMTVVTRF